MFDSFLRLSLSLSHPLQRSSVYRWWHTRFLRTSSPTLADVTHHSSSPEDSRWRPKGVECRKLICALISLFPSNWEHWTQSRAEEQRKEDVWVTNTRGQSCWWARSTVTHSFFNQFGLNTEPVSVFMPLRHWEVRLSVLESVFPSQEDKLNRLSPLYVHTFGVIQGCLTRKKNLPLDEVH